MTASGNRVFSGVGAAIVIRRMFGRDALHGRLTETLTRAEGQLLIGCSRGDALKRRQAATPFSANNQYKPFWFPLGHTQGTRISKQHCCVVLHHRCARNLVVAWTRILLLSSPRLLQELALSPTTCLCGSSMDRHNSIGRCSYPVACNSWLLGGSTRRISGKAGRSRRPPRGSEIVRPT
jgi:hypothetical protein